MGGVDKAEVVELAARRGIMHGLAASRVVDDPSEAAVTMDEFGDDVVFKPALKPLDMDTVLASVARTGRVVIVHEAPLSGGLGAEIAARLAGDGLAYLLAPVERVTGFDIPMPLARREDDYLPGPARILAACQRVLAC